MDFHAKSAAQFTWSGSAERFQLSRWDEILAKGQCNYESMSGQGRHVFYEFLCKCDQFTNRFQVPKLTGMFIEASA